MHSCSVSCPHLAVQWAGSLGAAPASSAALRQGRGQLAPGAASPLPGSSWISPGSAHVIRHAVRRAGTVICWGNVCTPGAFSSQCSLLVRSPSPLPEDWGDLQLARYGDLQLAGAAAGSPGTEPRGPGQLPRHTGCSRHPRIFQSPGGLQSTGRQP